MWIKRGRPDHEVVAVKWAEYRASLPSWRNPKDLSTWLNNFGHTHDYIPAPAEKPKGNGIVSAAVAIEQGRSHRVLTDRLKRIQGELTPEAPPPDPRQEYAARAGGTK